MKVLEPGHYYVLDNLDDDAAEVPRNQVRLYFVKRLGEKFPGNTGNTGSGPISQEVIRALIDRTEYVDGQRKHHRNGFVLHHLREALRELEMRAAEERDDAAALFKIGMMEKPELAPACPRCGHIECQRRHEP